MKKGDLVICIRKSTNSVLKEEISKGKIYKVKKCKYDKFSRYDYCKVDEMRTHWSPEDFKVCTREIKLKRLLNIGKS